MMATPGELAIRLARPGDRPAMEHICAHTWDDGDYIPEVWDAWLADPRGALIVGEMGERVVALSRIAFRTPGEVWLEGMRVDPDYRRQGIAARFLEYSLAYSFEQGARVVRLGTGDYNTPIHTIAARVGMQCVGKYGVWEATPWLEGPPPTFLSADHAAEVEVFLLRSPVLAHLHGLYSLDWKWQELPVTRSAELLAQPQVLGERGEDGSLLALALIDCDGDDPAVWIGFADGEPAALTRLAGAVRTHAARVGAARVRLTPPDLPWLRDAFRLAGYGAGGWEGDLWIFERRLESHDGGGVPERVAPLGGLGMP